ncbi:uncharacterized protein MELLADRAFT_95460 [Melampsora larici-populina 98AG31]|uniref:Uncharacterized protein n=1 Tax=Melampsora larici-populina (strain 98AG31 / pathotype 3-4-7) TaxID=747676 RepID=F4S9E9_MELLP|nr:uncharacterized protein MELLADRAFT_95460 [Melampsora larici-populina 98AG31]EGF98741.1 hypothetical protein MELLADRAFT_95460 [Melampsora larici-populina 98AG31]
MRRSASPNRPLVSGPMHAGTLFEFKMTAFKSQHISIADQRRGVRPTSVCQQTGPTSVRIDLAILNLQEFKDAVADLAEGFHLGCRDLFKEADLKGTIDYFGWVTNNPSFPKGRQQNIGKDVDFERFKVVVSENRGKSMGVTATMIDENAKPRKNRAVQNANSFDRLMLADNPGANPERARKLALNAINLQADLTEIRTALQTRYGNSGHAGHREGMTCYDPERPKFMMRLTYPMLDVWAELIAAGKPGVTLFRPPVGLPGFEWVLKSGKPTGIPADSLTLPSSVPAQSQSTSPAPQPYPDFEDYLTFCRIPENNGTTRDVLKKLQIIEFDEFFSAENLIDFLKSQGIGHGPVVRLSTKASQYRQDLKSRQA